MSVRDRLLAFIRDLQLPLDGEVGDETQLIDSGRLDSLALVELALWVEGEVGKPLDPAAFDLRMEWQTVSSVVRFIERHRNSTS